MSDTTKLDRWLDELDDALAPMAPDAKLTFIDGIDAAAAWLATPSAVTILTVFEALGDARTRRGINDAMETIGKLAGTATGVPLGQRQGVLARERRLAEKAAKAAANKAPRAKREPKEEVLGQVDPVVDSIGA